MTEAECDLYQAGGGVSASEVQTDGALQAEDGAAKRGGADGNACAKKIATGDGGVCLMGLARVRGARVGSRHEALEGAEVCSGTVGCASFDGRTQLG